VREREREREQRGTEGECCGAAARVSPAVAAAAAAVRGSFGALTLTQWLESVRSVFESEFPDRDYKSIAELM
jgi:hypothetical protein